MGINTLLTKDHTENTTSETADHDVERTPSASLKNCTMGGEAAATAVAVASAMVGRTVVAWTVTVEIASALLVLWTSLREQPTPSIYST